MVFFYKVYIGYIGGTLYWVHRGDSIFWKLFRRVLYKVLYKVF